MPYKNPHDERAKAAKRKWWRENRGTPTGKRGPKPKAEGGGLKEPPHFPGAAPSASLPLSGRRQPPAPLEVGLALAKWCRDTLKIPPGHANAGQPLVIPPYGIDFLRDALRSRESLLCIARKNAKSAIIAAFLLARLCSGLPGLHIRGYRGGVTSVSKEKANELRIQMEAIATASSLLHKVRFLRSPAPGRVVSATGSVDILSADKSAGHASGFDDAIIDELGLLQERHRELVNGMRSSISARAGRFIALSIRGLAPFTREMIERRKQDGINVHLYAAPARCKLSDMDAWRAANPGLDYGIKSLDYMRGESEHAAAIPADESAFRAYDLNQEVEPSQEMIVSVSAWEKVLCQLDDLPEDRGPVVIGFDAGGAASMTAAAILWTETGRMEVYGAFGDLPSLAARGKADGVGGLYLQMHAEGSLQIFPGLVTPVAPFLAFLRARVDGHPLLAVGADRYRRNEVTQYLRDAGLDWRVVWRGTGASPTADGSRDIRAFQRMVLQRRISFADPCTILESAIGDSQLRYDAAGNPALDKARFAGRIDALSSAVIAGGLAESVYNTGTDRMTLL